jgi:hypothetical protein
MMVETDVVFLCYRAHQIIIVYHAAHRSSDFIDGKFEPLCEIGQRHRGESLLICNKETLQRLLFYSD